MKQFQAMCSNIRLLHELFRATTTKCKYIENDVTIVITRWPIMEFVQIQLSSWTSAANAVISIYNIFGIIAIQLICRVTHWWTADVFSWISKSECFSIIYKSDSCTPAHLIGMHKVPTSMVAFIICIKPMQAPFNGQAISIKSFSIAQRFCAVVSKKSSTRQVIVTLTTHNMLFLWFDWAIWTLALHYERDECLYFGSKRTRGRTTKKHVKKQTKRKKCKRIFNLSIFAYLWWLYLSE